MVNGESKGPVGEVTVKGGKDTTLDALFTDKDNLIVITKPTENGSVTVGGATPEDSSPTGAVNSYLPGSTVTVTITPDEGYYVRDVLVNGVSMGAQEFLELADIGEDYDIVVLFAPVVELNDDDHFAYIIGYPGENVRPEGNITREETATIFFRLLTETSRDIYLSQSNAFADVADSRWSNTAISTLTDAGIIKGKTNTAFDPSGSITRAEFAVIAARFIAVKYSGEDIFSDISGHWAENEINSAAAHGWIEGFNGLFRPNDLITRAEAMTLINRVLGRLPEAPGDLLDDMITWPDNSDTSVWYYLAVQEATNSHYYELKADGIHESWTDLREAYDWAQWEK